MNRAEELEKEVVSLRDEIRTLEDERNAFAKVVAIGYFSENEEVTALLHSAVSAYDNAIARDDKKYFQTMVAILHLD